MMRQPGVVEGQRARSSKINDIFNQMYLRQLSMPQATNQAIQQIQQANQAVQAAASGG